MPMHAVHAKDARALQDIADTVAKSHKILIITGAGISTNCGIPDFRSKDGLYNMIPTQVLPPTPPPSNPSTPSRKRKASAAFAESDDELPSSQSSTSSRWSSTSPASRMKGQDLFHARVFQSQETTEVFYQFIASLRRKIETDVKDTSATHKFIRVLRDAGRLMRCYTQNIDGLERREGLCMDLTRGKGNKRRFMKKHFETPRPENTRDTDFDGGCEVVQLHGELTKLRCTMCSSEETWTEEATEMLLDGHAPPCEICMTKSEIRQATGKRGMAVGSLRPNIVLYGEEHPQNTLLSPFVPYDISSNPDVLVIMGTSLKVHGLQKIIRDFAKTVHNQKNGRVIFVNNTRPAESVWDGIIDDFVAMDCDGWVKDLKARREDLWLRQGEINLKETKPTSLKRMRKSDIVDEDGTEMIAKKTKVKQSSTITVEIPKMRSVDRKPVTAPARRKTTGWKAKVGNSTTDNTPSSEVQTPTHRQNRRAHAQSIIDAALSHAQDSPQQPGFSPITPTFSSLASTPTSRCRSITSTPSKLRTVSHVNDTIVMDDDVENRHVGKGSADDVEGDDATASDDLGVSTPGIRHKTQPRRSLSHRLRAGGAGDGGESDERTCHGRLLASLLMERTNART